jgi:hypothetical protein
MANKEQVDSTATWKYQSITAMPNPMQEHFSVLQHSAIFARRRILLRMTMPSMRILSQPQMICDITPSDWLMPKAKTPRGHNCGIMGFRTALSWGRRLHHFFQAGYEAPTFAREIC